MYKNLIFKDTHIKNAYLKSQYDYKTFTELLQKIAKMPNVETYMGWRNNLKMKQSPLFEVLKRLGGNHYRLIRDNIDRY